MPHKGAVHVFTKIISFLFRMQKKTKNQVLMRDWIDINKS